MRLHSTYSIAKWGYLQGSEVAPAAGLSASLSFLLDINPDKRKCGAFSETQTALSFSIILTSMLCLIPPGDFLSHQDENGEESFTSFCLLHGSMFLTLHSQNPVLIFKRFYFSVWSGTATPSPPTFLHVRYKHCTEGRNFALYSLILKCKKRERAKRKFREEKRSPFKNIIFTLWLRVINVI